MNIKWQSKRNDKLSQVLYCNKRKEFVKSRNRKCDEKEMEDKKNSQCILQNKTKKCPEQFARS